MSAGGDSGNVHSTLVPLGSVTGYEPFSPPIISEGCAITLRFCETALVRGAQAT